MSRIATSSTSASRGKKDLTVTEKAELAQGIVNTYRQFKNASGSTLNNLRRQLVGVPDSSGQTYVVMTPSLVKALRSEYNKARDAVLSFKTGRKKFTSGKFARDCIDEMKREKARREAGGAVVNELESVVKAHVNVDGASVEVTADDYQTLKEYASVLNKYVNDAIDLLGNLEKMRAKDRSLKRSSARTILIGSGFRGIVLVADRYADFMTNAVRNGLNYITTQLYPGRADFTGYMENMPLMTQYGIVSRMTLQQTWWFYHAVNKQSLSSADQKGLAVNVELRDLINSPLHSKGFTNLTSGAVDQIPLHPDNPNRTIIEEANIKSEANATLGERAPEAYYFNPDSFSGVDWTRIASAANISGRALLEQYPEDQLRNLTGTLGGNAFNLYETFLSITRNESRALTAAFDAEVNRGITSLDNQALSVISGSGVQFTVPVMMNLQAMFEGRLIRNAYSFIKTHRENIEAQEREARRVRNEQKRSENRAKREREAAEKKRASEQRRAATASERAARDAQEAAARQQPI